MRRYLVVLGLLAAVGLFLVGGGVWRFLDL